MKNTSFETLAFGLSYIGLPTAAVMTNRGGLRVIGIDIRAGVVNTINGGWIHIFEPRLAAAYRK